MTLLCPNDVIALRKCLAAESFATYPGAVAIGHWRKLAERGLIHWLGGGAGWRLTDKGRDALAQVANG